MSRVQNRDVEQQQPLVTVVTAVYNIVTCGRSAALRQCIESVHAQTYPHIEHVMIDGASNDGTLEILRPYEEQGWLEVYSEPDRGLYDAMNKGIARARGKYTVFLNSDDFWHDEEGLAESVRRLEAEQGDFSYAHAFIMNHRGELVEFRPAEICLFIEASPFCHQTMLTRTDLLKRLGGFQGERYPIAADYEMIMRLLLQGCKPTYVPLCFATFRMGGVSSDGKKQLLESDAQADAVRAEHLGEYFGDAVQEHYRRGIAPEGFAQFLTRLHPDVAALFRTFTWMAHQRIFFRAYQVIPYRGGSVVDGPVKQVKVLRLLGIPVYRRTRVGDSKRTSYGGVVVVEKECHAAARLTKVKLFSFVPLVRVREGEDGRMVCKLFNLLPLVARSR